MEGFGGVLDGALNPALFYELPVLTRVEFEIVPRIEPPDLKKLRHIISDVSS